MMSDYCTARTRDQALTELAAARIPAYPINSPQDALDDPQVAAMGFLAPTPYPGLAQDATLVETPFRMDGSAPGFAMRPPMVGEHTDMILQELGFGPAEIAALRKQDVV